MQIFILVRCSLSTPQLYNTNAPTRLKTVCCAVLLPLKLLLRSRSHAQQLALPDIVDTPSESGRQLSPHSFLLKDKG